LKKSKVDFRLDFGVCAPGRPARTAAKFALVTRGKSCQIDRSLRCASQQRVSLALNGGVVGSRNPRISHPELWPRGGGRRRPITRDRVRLCNSIGAPIGRTSGVPRGRARQPLLVFARARLRTGRPRACCTALLRSFAGACLHGIVLTMDCGLGFAEPLTDSRHGGLANRSFGDILAPL
jgi:hypothetical protein